MTDEQEKISQEFLSKYPNLKDDYIADKLKNNKIQTLGLRGMAPRLSDYYIYFIGDSKNGSTYYGENIARNQTVTKF